MKFAAIITIFNPTIDDVIHIIHYDNVFDELIVYDNSSDNSSYYQLFLNHSRISYYFNKKNEGLCIPINKGLRYCVKKKISFLCTLDQDSDFSKKDIKDMKQFIINNFDSFSNNVAIFSPKIIYDNNSNLEHKDEFEFKKFAISSGSFLNIKLLSSNNIWYDEFYFLDRFEKDFCKQILNKGYKILQYNKVFLFQQLGQKINGHTTHKPFRHYYMFRNRFYYNNKFYNNSKAILLNILETINQIRYIFFYEPEKIKKIIQLKKAYIDYKSRGEKK